MNSETGCSDIFINTSDRHLSSVCCLQTGQNSKPGHEVRKLRVRLERQESMQKDWQWRREGMRLGGAVSGWLELELKLPAVSVHLSTLTLSSRTVDYDEH